MRLPRLEPDQLSELLHDYAADPQRRAVVLGLGHCPEILKAWLDLYYQVTRQPGRLGVVRKEMVRHLLAQLSGCEVCQAQISTEALEQGLTLDKISQLSQPDERFPAAEQVMLQFARRLFGGHEQVSSDDFARLQLHFSAEEITELGFVVSFFAASARLNFGFGVFEPD